MYQKKLGVTARRRISSDLRDLSLLVGKGDRCDWKPQNCSLHPESKGEEGKELGRRGLATICAQFVPGTLGRDV